MFWKMMSLWEAFYKDFWKVVHKFKSTSSCNWNGLIRARLKGAALWKGCVVLFLGAHWGWSWVTEVSLSQDETWQDNNSVSCHWNAQWWSFEVVATLIWPIVGQLEAQFSLIHWEIFQREMDRRKDDWTLPISAPTLTEITFRKLEYETLEWLIKKETT